MPPLLSLCTNNLLITTHLHSVCEL
jgi:hypothetical protein